MTVTLTATGATVTTGRGKAKTIILSVSFAELERWAKRMRIEEARVWRKAYGSAIRSIKGQFQKIVANAGGVEGVPKFKDFEQFTVELRNATGRSTPMGGVLADKRRIVSYKQNGWQVIGWPDALAKWAIKFQDGEGGPVAERFLTGSKSRYWMHKQGIANIPYSYTHNPRRVIPEPFGSHIRKYLDTWAQNVYFKELARQMAKA